MTIKIQRLTDWIRRQQYRVWGCLDLKNNQSWSLGKINVTLFFEFISEKNRAPLMNLKILMLSKLPYAEQWAQAPIVDVGMFWLKHEHWWSARGCFIRGGHFFLFEQRSIVVLLLTYCPCKASSNSHSGLAHLLVCPPFSQHCQLTAGKNVENEVVCGSSLHYSSVTITVLLTAWIPKFVQIYICAFCFFYFCLFSPPVTWLWCWTDTFLATKGMKQKRVELFYGCKWKGNLM